MLKKLDGLNWRCLWTSHIGCIKGCLDYLGLDVSTEWLFGATGHAFIINIHEVVCASGPTAWNTEMIFELGENIGYETGGAFTHKKEDDFEEQKELVWKNTKLAVNNNIPTYGWELDIPEFYIIYGYDDEGYYYKGPLSENGKGPKSWRELGETDIGVIEMYSITKGNPVGDRKIVREAFRFVLEHSTSPEKWIFPLYKSGLGGYDNWIAALEEEKANAFGMSYNTAVWDECRHYGIEFLKEAKTRLGENTSTLFDKAIEHYGAVSENLHKLSELLPFPQEDTNVIDKKITDVSIDLLTDTRNNEEKGLKTLERIFNELK